MFAQSIFARQVCGASPQIFTKALPSSASRFVLTGQRQATRFSSALARPVTQQVANIRPTRFFAGAAGVVAAGLGLFAYSRPIFCEGGEPIHPTMLRDVSDQTLQGSPPPGSATPPPPAPAAAGDHKDIPPPPTSTVSLYELSFGTVAGICAGVFVRKGAKMVAFALGGVFVLLQVCCETLQWVSVLTDRPSISVNSPSSRSIGELSARASRICFTELMRMA